ncbi:MAG: hypothetical protein IJT80_07640 [Lachnospiraceae bacterium]|nr:hypothetical protein [Lachnospiraceae bacterium]
MSEASKRTLEQLDRLVSNERRNPRKVFMKIFFAGEFYKMDRNRLISEAKKAGAFYIIGNVSLIKVRRLDEYLESKRMREVMA